MKDLIHHHAMPKYRPSNGTEGGDFYERWCAKCQMDAALPNGCEILNATILYAVDDPKYPSEWIEDNDGPKCLAFVPLGNAR